LLSQIPNALSGTCTLTCQTKYGNTVVGTKSCSFVLSTDETVSISEFSVSPLNDNPFLSDKNIFVAGYSKAATQLTAAAGKGASIVSSVISCIKSAGSPLEWTDDTIIGADATAFTATVTDSRNTVASVSREISVCGYQVPLAILYAERGDNLKITLKYSLSLREYGNSPTFSVSIDDVPIDVSGMEITEYDTEAYSEAVCYYSGYLSKEEFHIVKASVTDSLGNTSAVVEVEIPTEVVNMSFKSNNSGVTFGGHPVEEGFVCNFPAKFYGDFALDPVSNGFNAEFLPDYEEGTVSLARLLLDFAHPVGSFYWSCVGTDPGQLFGGTWEQVKDKFILAAGDTYGAGTSGGEAVVSLKTAELPAHTHGSKSLSGHFTIRSCDTGGLTDSIVGNSGIVTKTRNTWSGTHERFTTASNSNPNYEVLTINATHEHSSVGDGTAHNNMPPYITAYCWMRTS